jgi:hypothetical protein
MFQWCFSVRADVWRLTHCSRGDLVRCRHLHPSCLRQLLGRLMRHLVLMSVEMALMPVIANLPLRSVIALESAVCTWTCATGGCQPHNLCKLVHGETMLRNARTRCLT